MSKKKSAPRLEENEARAVLRGLRASPQKLNLVAAMIRGLPVERALSDLSFARVRLARDVKKVLESAISNAENNAGLDIDTLFVSEAYVGKAFVLKRWAARARGRSTRIEKPFSTITIVLKEREEFV